VVYVDPRGDNCIVVHPGANHRVPTDIYDSVQFRQGELLLSQLEVNLDAVGAAFDSARRRGVTTVLNPSPLKEIPDTLLRDTSMLVANVQEAQELGGVTITDVSTARSCAAALRQRGPDKVAITLGKEGAILCDGAECCYVRGIEVESVDTQGAGDAFLGAFVARLAHGESDDEALAFGNRVAAYSVTRRGTTQRSLPDRNDPFLSARQEILTV
jgi:ribokinase